MQDEQTGNWLDFYLKMRAGLDTSDRRKLDKEFFGSNSQKPRVTNTLQTLQFNNNLLGQYNKPYFELIGNDDNYRSRLHPDDGHWNLMPELFAGGNSTFMKDDIDLHNRAKSLIANDFPMYVNPSDRESMEKLADPEYVKRYEGTAKFLTDYLTRRKEEYQNFEPDRKIRESVMDDNPTLRQTLADLNFEEKWKRLPREVRNVLTMRNNLYNELTPDTRDLINPPKQPAPPFKPQRVDWEESRTKNLETTPEAQAALVQRIQQLQGGQLPIDLQAGMVEPSVAGDAFQRSAVNNQNIAVVKERMAARKEAVPWLGRLLAPESSTGMIMDPRLSLPGFTEDNRIRPRLDRKDPVVRQIEDQNKIVKRGTTPSKKETAAQKKRALVDLAFLEESIKSKRGGNVGAWLMSLLGANELAKERSKGR